MSHPIEAHTDPYILAGRIVTMNSAFDVIDDGLLYIQQGTIIAVADRNIPAPAGFENAPIIETNGTIFPGLIEIHNHISYNILPLWQVPQQFKSRDQWRNHAQKRSLVTAPMAVLANTPNYPEAIVRYVECKCLVAGVTTSQGISLYGVELGDYYRGIIRNVEAPNHIHLPAAHTRIDDVDDVEKFWRRLEGVDGTLLLHL
jgi:5-methylthioadenosine/S-adenosylhomocysteine deaminase